MEVTLQAERRAETGSAAARRLRRDNKVPAVVYGRDLDATPVIVDQRDLVGVLHTEAGLNVLINLEIDGSGTHLTLPRFVQRHPVKGEILHVDFIKISLTETVQAEVPIELEGEPEAVRMGDAVVDHIRTVVRVEALPQAVPGHITMDISEMVLGDVLRVEDLPSIDGVEYLAEPDAPVASVSIPRLEVEEEPEEEELEEGVELLEGEEVEGVEPEEGEQPPEGEAAEEPPE